MENLKQELENFNKKYTEIQKNINVLQQDLLRLEGIILFLQQKTQDQNKENLTNS